MGSQIDLAAAESERTKLVKLENQPRRPPAPVVERVISDLPARYLRMVNSIERVPELEPAVAREELRGFMGEVTMTPRKGGGLVAEARLDGTALLQKVFENQRHTTMVAGVGFEPTTFGL